MVADLELRCYAAVQPEYQYCTGSKVGGTVDTVCSVVSVLPLQYLLQLVIVHPSCLSACLAVDEAKAGYGFACI